MIVFGIATLIVAAAIYGYYRAKRKDNTNEP